MAEPLLIAENLTYAATSARGEQRILRGVSLAAEAGEVLGICGPNGAGKTTLLKALAGLLPTGGEVRVAGKALRQYSPKQLARQLAYMHQETQVPFDFTAGQIVAMGRFPYHGALGAPGVGDAAAIDQALAEAECNAFANEPITHLSGGERQRVMLARTLAQQTPILFLDEPTASLDARLSQRIFTLAEKLAAQGKLVVLVAHDLRAAAAHCSRVALLAEGRLVALAAPSVAFSEAALSEAYGVPLKVFGNPAGQWDYYLEP